MKNNRIVSTLSPKLIGVPTERGRHSLLTSLSAGLIFWTIFLVAVLWLALGVGQAQTIDSDPLVMKVYPDGTKVILRWSEVGQKIDHGEKFGGAPKIVAYDPAEQGIVPIGEPSQKAGAGGTNAVPQGTSSVVTSEQPAKMDYTNAEPSKFDEQIGPLEGFAFRTAVGPSFQQSLSGRSNDGETYNNLTFKPGIRFDLEPSYNVTDWFRVGMETAFIYNRIQRLQANDANVYPGDSNLGNAGLFQVPILANVRFQFPSDGPWRGYLGGGLGAGWDILQASTTNFDEDTGLADPSSYTSYHWNFIYQITTGFTYTISQGFDLDIGYKLLSAPNPSFQSLGKFQASYNHSVEVGLAWRF